MKLSPKLSEKLRYKFVLVLVNGFDEGNKNYWLPLIIIFFLRKNKKLYLASLCNEVLSTANDRDLRDESPSKQIALSIIKLSWEYKTSRFFNPAIIICK